MRHMKKTWALVLALVMVFSLSATAFATGNGVPVAIQGIPAAFTQSVTAEDIATLCDGANHLYTIPEYVTDALTGYTAADALIAAYMMENGIDSIEDLTEDEITTAWYNTAAEGEPAHYGLYFTKYAGKDSGAGAYYYVSQRTEGGKTYYTYNWKGNSWTLSVNGSVANEYASEYLLSGVTSVSFNYAETESGNFETTTYIADAIGIPSQPNP